MSSKIYLPLILALITIGNYKTAFAQETGGYTGPTYSVDSLRKMLMSRNVDQEGEALWYINEKIQGDIPAILVNPILSIIEKESKHRRFTPRDEDNYMSQFMDLVIAAWRTKQPAARRYIVMSGGIGISGGVDNFIAEDVRPLFKALDSIAIVSDFQSTGVVNIYGLALAKHPAQLQKVDSTHIVGLFLSTISDTSSINRMETADVIGKIPLLEFVPVLKDMKSSDSHRGIDNSFPVREFASEALAKIESKWRSMPPPKLLDRLDFGLDVFCEESKRSKFRRYCLDLKKSLRQAERHMRERRKSQAKEELRDFSRQIARAYNNGDLHRTHKAFFKGNADAIVGRL